jgi:hypothetical protein
MPMLLEDVETDDKPLTATTSGVLVDAEDVARFERCFVQFCTFLVESSCGIGSFVAFGALGACRRSEPRSLRMSSAPSCSVNPSLGQCGSVSTVGSSSASPESVSMILLFLHFGVHIVATKSRPAVYQNQGLKPLHPPSLRNQDPDILGKRKKTKEEELKGEQNRKGGEEKSKTGKLIK